MESKTLSNILKTKAQSHIVNVQDRTTDFPIVMAFAAKLE